MTDDEIREMLTEATPGPWHVIDYGDERGLWVAATEDGNGHVGTSYLSVCCSSIGEANVHLIASAPDLAAEVLRLRAELAKPVKVKPLVWDNVDAWEYWARTKIGTYYVKERNGVWKTILDRKDGSGGELIYEYTTDGFTPDDFQAAQIAAQADHDARIRAQIEDRT